MKKNNGFVLKMENEIYVTGVIIANGIPDSDGDVLDKKQIKQLLTKYEQDTDTMHTYIKNDGVDVIENWITEIPTIIGGQSVPAGSWLATMKISNTELINSITNGNLNAFSLGSVPQEAFTEKFWFINKSMTYSDVSDIENLKPLFISFVDKGANGYTFEIMTYEAYINKNDKTEVKEMSEEKMQSNEDMVSVSALEKIGKIFGFSVNKSADATVETEPVVETEPTPAPIDMDALKQDIEEAVTIGIKKGVAEATAIKTEEEEETTEEKEEVEETAEPIKNEPETVEDIKINKRQTKKEEEVEMPQTETSFYKRTGRDAFGCKIKK